MHNTVVVDFDGTLVVENSSRVLEQVMFARYAGRLRPAIGWMFFGGGRRCVNAISLILGSLTRRRIDWRFIAFLRIMSRPTANQFGAICEVAAAELTPNMATIGCLDRESQVIVASCGLAPVIDAFISKSGMDALVLRASEITVTTSGRLLATLLEPRDKNTVLQVIPALHYVTDDRAEALMVRDDRERMRKVAVEVFEQRGLYHVVDDNFEETNNASSH